MSFLLDTDTCSAYPRSISFRGLDAEFTGTEGKRSDRRGREADDGDGQDTRQRRWGAVQINGPLANFPRQPALCQDAKVIHHRQVADGEIDIGEYSFKNDDIAHASDERPAREQAETANERAIADQGQGV